MPVTLLIVVPTLNSHKLLARLIRSLQAQCWPHWRLLFVDGPSGKHHRQWLESCCLSESRCSWIAQDPDHPGIFGAMNQGFAHAASQDWLLFWGSDDLAAAPDVLVSAIACIESSTFCPDLLVCHGRYFNASSGQLTRRAVFRLSGLLSGSSYRRALLFGSTPPHQATLFGPGARQFLARYAPGFRLSADLDYFLQLSKFPDLVVQCLDLELVHMADAGVSAQQGQRRLQEVVWAYCRAFSWRWLFPFVARYIRRLASLAALR